MIDGLLAAGAVTPAARFTLGVILVLTASGLAAILFRAWRMWDRRRSLGEPGRRRRR